MKIMHVQVLGKRMETKSRIMRLTTGLTMISSSKICQNTWA